MASKVPSSSDAVILWSYEQTHLLMKKERECGIEDNAELKSKTWVQLLPSTVNSYVTLCKFLNFSGSQLDFMASEVPSSSRAMILLFAKYRARKVGLVFKFF